MEVHVPTNTSAYLTSSKYYSRTSTRTTGNVAMAVVLARLSGDVTGECHYAALPTWWHRGQRLQGISGRLVREGTSSTNINEGKPEKVETSSFFHLL